METARRPVRDRLKQVMEFSAVLSIGISDPCLCRHEVYCLIPSLARKSSERLFRALLHPRPSRPSLLDRTYIALCLNPLVSPQTPFPNFDVGALSSVDRTSTWTTISGPGSGLPTLPHCTDLVFSAEQTGVQWLYFGTHSWSIWRTLLSAPFPNEGYECFRAI